ncbi:hypothetical protein A2U01_0033517, partial [Trifolium medium]|nr:hypothetical protein [Trifolium medium]
PCCISCLRWLPSWFDHLAGDRLSYPVLPSCYDGKHRGAMDADFSC